MCWKVNLDFLLKSSGPTFKAYPSFKHRIEFFIPLWQFALLYPASSNSSYLVEWFSAWREHAWQAWINWGVLIRKLQPPCWCSWRLWVMELEAASYCTACTGGKDVESLLPLIASEMAEAVGIFFLFLSFTYLHPSCQWNLTKNSPPAH